MTNEITKPQMHIELRNGLSLPVDAEKVKVFMQEVERCKFVQINGEYVNTADISGVFKPKTIEARNKKKAGKGNWKCEIHGNKIEFNKKCGYCASGMSPRK